MDYDEDIEVRNLKLLQETGGMYMIMPTPPTALYSIIPESLWHYWGMPKFLQRNQQRTNLVRGRVGWFVCQSSHGRQQIKLYQPWNYKNEVNTPLRIRSRTIVQLAAKEPIEKRKEKIRELYYTYPYHLLKSEPINLKMKNFYFDFPVMKGNTINIYRAIDPEHPDPLGDSLYCEKEFGEKRTVRFEYEQETEQFYYAVNMRNNEISNVLKFVWQDILNFQAKTVRKPNKWAQAAMLVNADKHFKAEEIPEVIFLRNKYTEDFHRALDERERDESVGDKKVPVKKKPPVRRGHFYYYYKGMQQKYELLQKEGYFGKRE